jgi:prepilin-type N-terminal cleavage/methylation domain-containing protein
MKNITNKRKNAGFTLLELVVVVAVMGLISSMAMDLYTDNTNQTRYDLTKKRVEEIRYAIIGDDSRTLNGQPTISGYIADTGKVPTEIRQLILKEYCIGDPLYFTKNHCESGGETWKNQETEINWKGPYLKTLTSEKLTRTINGALVISNVPVFRDGWGRSLGHSNEDMKNFGWEFKKDLVTEGIILQSYGLDRTINVSSTDPDTQLYEEDYPSVNIELVTSNDYSSYSSAINYRIENKSSSDKTVCLLWEGTSISTGNSSPKTIIAGETSGPTAINLTTMGHLVFTLEEDTDGNCDTDTNGNESPISLFPNIVVVSSDILTPPFEAIIN